MADVTETGLRAVVKALTTVVAPALDPSDPLAKEQLKLAVDYIEFVRARLEHLYDRDRFELTHSLALARAVLPLGAASPSTSTSALLDGALREGAAELARVGANPVALKSAAAALGAAVRELVREAAGFDAAQRRAIEAAVLRASDARIAFERAWYLPLGFDPAPHEVGALAEVLAAALAAAPGFPSTPIAPAR